MKTLFLHSWGGSKHDWDRIAADFPEGLFVDLRGFGDAPAPDGPYDVASYVEDVLRTVEDWGEYAIVGHSMGGKIALATAMRRPAGLRRLFLVAPSPPTPEPMSDEEREANLRGYGSREFARKTVEKITCAPLPEPTRQQAEDDYVRTSERAWKAWLEVGSKEDLSSGMSNIAVPVHVVVGKEDPVMHPDMLRREVVARLRDVTFQEVEGSGHLLPSERPDELAEFLRTRLRGEAGLSP